MMHDVYTERRIYNDYVDNLLVRIAMLEGQLDRCANAIASQQAILEVTSKRLDFFIGDVEVLAKSIIAKWKAESLGRETTP